MVQHGIETPVIWPPGYSKVSRSLYRRRAIPKSIVAPHKRTDGQTDKTVL